MPRGPRLRTPPSARRFTRDPEVLEPTSISSPEVLATINAVREPAPTQPLTHTPEDWRDGWIYFAMIDRFNNPDVPPRHEPYDAPFGGFQGGTIDGLWRQLDYLKALGAGAI